MTWNGKDSRKWAVHSTRSGDIRFPLNLKQTPNVVDNIDAQEKVRNHLIRFTDCENVLVQGVTLLNSPRFHLIPTRCKNVVIDGITVKCPWNAQNGDAIDISSCKDVLIVNNVVDAGDDGICMKRRSWCGWRESGSMREYQHPGQHRIPCSWRFCNR